MKKQQKRYQYISNQGVCWSEWFNYDGPQEPWQLKSSKLRNEYRTIEI